MEFKDARSYLKMLEKKKRELERRIENLNKMRERNEITEEEYLKEKRRIEREYVEVMDRLVQMKYITGQQDLFS